jgi:hypothetical protein
MQPRRKTKEAGAERGRTNLPPRPDAGLHSSCPLRRFVTAPVGEMASVRQDFLVTTQNLCRTPSSNDEIYGPFAVGRTLVSPKSQTVSDSVKPASNCA